MNRRLVVLGSLTLLAGCAYSGHAVQASSLGAASGSSQLLELLLAPGPVELETVVSAQWEVARSGLINLQHQRAREAGLEDGPEPIQVYFHALRHPQRGLYIVDTGVERALRDAPQRAVLRGMVARAAGVDQMKIQLPLADWLAKQPEPLSGVLLTHLHLDHIAGLPDVPKGTPLYAGPGETLTRSAMNLLLAPVVDEALQGHAPLSQWPFQVDPDGRFAGVVDVFGDQTVWALHVPGHTPGSTAYLVRTPQGPVLLAGDSCHTRWGWDHQVEPGTFTHDLPMSVDSLSRLKDFVAAHPEVSVRLGHQ